MAKLLPNAKLESWKNWIAETAKHFAEKSRINWMTEIDAHDTNSIILK